MAQARKLQLEAQKYSKILMKYDSFVAATRAIMIMKGLDVGPPRLPHAPLSEKEFQSLKNELENAGFFDSK